MFEQSLVVAGPANRWSMVSSLMVQAAGVTTLLLVPLIWVDVLPPIQNLPPSVFAPRHREPVKVFTDAKFRPSAAPVVQPRLFTPINIPSKTPIIVERRTLLEEGGDIPVGKPDGLLTSLANSDPFGNIGKAAPPPPQPKPAEPKPASVTPKSVTVTSSLQASKLISQVKPAYPELAKRARVQGVVRLHAVIAQDGTVQRLQIASGHPLLVQAAVEAVRQWRYSPTLLGGNPVEVVTQIDVNFVLSQ